MERYVGYEVFTVVVMKSIIFWDMTACNLSICSSEMSVEIRRTTQRRISEDDTLRDGKMLINDEIWEEIGLKYFRVKSG
jgi:hypothetical protein